MLLTTTASGRPDYSRIVRAGREYDRAIGGISDGFSTRSLAKSITDTHDAIELLTPLADLQTPTGRGARTSIGQATKAVVILEKIDGLLASFKIGTDLKRVYIDQELPKALTRLERAKDAIVFE